MRHWTDQRILRERRRKRAITAVASLAILTAFVFILLSFVGCIFGCVTVEKVQVGPEDWTTFSNATTRPSYTGPTEPLEDDTQTPMEIIDELFGDIEANR